MFDRSAQHFGRSDEARARQAISALLVFLDLLKRHTEVCAQFLLRHVVCEAERSHSLTDNLVHLAARGALFFVLVVVAIPVVPAFPHTFKGAGAN